MVLDGFLPVYFTSFSVGGNWDMPHDVVAKLLDLEPTSVWKTPERSFRSVCASPEDARIRRKNGEKLSAFSSWRYELPPKSCIFLEESFREILDVFYSKRQALNDLLQNEIAWDADIHFAIYLSNFGQGGEVDECGVAPALGAPADVISQLAEMQTSFSILLHSIDKLESYEEGYLIDGWKVNGDAYASNYKEWNIVKKAQGDVSGES